MEFEMLASGYGLLEAPRVDDLGRFYFSDIPNGGVYRRNPGGNVETLIPKRKGVGGMNFNRSGGPLLPPPPLIYLGGKNRKNRHPFAHRGRKPGNINTPPTHGHPTV